MRKFKTIATITVAIIAICGTFAASHTKNMSMLYENVEALTSIDFMDDLYFSYAVSHVRDGNSNVEWYVEPEEENPFLDDQICEYYYVSRETDGMCIFAVNWN